MYRRRFISGVAMQENQWGFLHRERSAESRAQRRCAPPLNCKIASDLRAKCDFVHTLYTINIKKSTTFVNFFLFKSKIGGFFETSSTPLLQIKPQNKALKNIFGKKIRGISHFSLLGKKLSPPRTPPSAQWRFRTPTVFLPRQL